MRSKLFSLETLCKGMADSAEPNTKRTLKQANFLLTQGTSSSFSISFIELIRQSIYTNAAPTAKYRERAAQQMALHPNCSPETKRRRLCDRTALTAFTQWRDRQFHCEFVQLRQ